MCHLAASGLDVHDLLRPTMCQPLLRVHDAPSHSVRLADYPFGRLVCVRCNVVFSR